MPALGALKMMLLSLEMYESVRDLDELHRHIREMRAALVEVIEMLEPERRAIRERANG